MATSTLVQLAIAVVGAGGLGGGLGAWLNHLRESRRARLDGFVQLQAMWRSDMNRQQAEIDQLEEKVEHLEHVVVALSRELLKAGVDPIAVRRCLRPDKPAKETDPT